MITSSELLPKLKTILMETPKIQIIIYMEEQITRVQDLKAFPERVMLYTFSDVLQRGNVFKIGMLMKLFSHQLILYIIRYFFFAKRSC